MAPEGFIAQRGFVEVENGGYQVVVNVVDERVIAIDVERGVEVPRVDIQRRGEEDNSFPACR